MSEVEVEEKMNIYQKLTSIQYDLLSISIPKSGENKFGGFKYYELSDMLPPIITLCKEYDVNLRFSFPVNEEGECYKGILYLTNGEDPQDVLCTEVPFAKLEKLPKMNWAQSSGTYQTYMKRYLLLHTFMVMEDEIIDSLDGQTESNHKKTMKAIPPAVKKVQEKCKKDNPNEECDSKMLNRISYDMLKKGELTKSEREEVFEYLKKEK
jgi:hypothetical protein